MILATGLLVALALAAAVGAAIALGQGRWDAETRALRGRLEAARTAGPSPGRADLAGLPAPVERYLRAALPDGQPVIAAARLRHAGTFDVGGDGAPRWRPFRSDQRVTYAPPGFDWDARMAIAPGLVLHVRDRYVAGEGGLTAALFGLVTVAGQRGGAELAQGELLRFLAEAPWCPTALLPGPGLRWEPVDGSRARATLVDGPVACTLTFHFGDDGLVDSVRAESRARVEGGRVAHAPWEGRYWNHARHGGMMIPLDAEVAWILPAGRRPYWRGHIERVEFEPAAASPPA